MTSHETCLILILIVIIFVAWLWKLQRSTSKCSRHQPGWNCASDSGSLTNQQKNAKNYTGAPFTAGSPKIAGLGRCFSFSVWQVVFSGEPAGTSFRGVRLTSCMPWILNVHLFLKRSHKNILLSPLSKPWKMAIDDNFS